MYTKQQTTKDPYTIIITKEEIMEAFRSPETYELFKQALTSQILLAYRAEKEKLKEK